MTESFGSFTVINFVASPGMHCHLFYWWGEKRSKPPVWTCENDCGQRWHKWNGA